MDYTNWFYANAMTVADCPREFNTEWWHTQYIVLHVDPVAATNGLLIMFDVAQQSGVDAFHMEVLASHGDTWSLAGTASVSQVGRSYILVHGAVLEPGPNILQFSVPYELPGRWLLWDQIRIGSPTVTMTALSGNNGMVTPNGIVTIPYGQDAAFTVAADAYCHISTLETNGIEIELSPGTTNMLYTWPNVSEDGGVLNVAFAENHATNGTPEWWLASHELTNETWDVEAMADHDGDGMTTWQEWIAGTTPTNSQSVFVAEGNVDAQTSEHVLTWPSQTGRTYSVRWSDNLQSGFTEIAGDIPATPPVNVFTDTVQRTSGLLLYDVQATMNQE